MVSIKGTPKELVIVELWKAARPLTDQLMIDGKMTVEEAVERLERGERFFDILYGRSLKIDLSSDDYFDEWLYDRDNGPGTAKKVCYDLNQSVLWSKAGSILRNAGWRPPAKK